MTNFYGTHVLARSIAEERISHREHIQLGRISNPLASFATTFDQVVNTVKEKLQQPTLVPVYCFEYAPDC